MKKKIIGIFGVAVIIAGFIGFGMRQETTKTDTASVGKPTVKIGAILPLTGNLANNRATIQEAMTLALQDNNKKGDLKYNYEIIFEDYAGSSAKAVSAYYKLTNIDKVDAIVTSMSFASSPIAPLAEKDKKLHLSIAFGDKIAMANKYTFNFYTPVQELAKHFAHTLKSKNVKKTAIVYLNNAGYADLMAHVRTELTKNNIDIVLEESVNPGEKDFNLLIAKINSNNMDILSVLLLSPEIEIFYKQALQQKIKFPLTSISAFGTATNPELFEGLWFTQASISTNEFADYFKKVSGHAVQDQTASAYDIIDLIIYSHENANVNTNEKPNSDIVIETLKKVKNWQGVSGLFSINDDGTLDIKAELAIIKNGKIEVIEE